MTPRSGWTWVARVNPQVIGQREGWDVASEEAIAWILWPTVGGYQISDLLSIPTCWRWHCLTLFFPLVAATFTEVPDWLLQKAGTRRIKRCNWIKQYSQTLSGQDWCGLFRQALSSEEVGGLHSHLKHGAHWTIWKRWVRLQDASNWLKLLSCRMLISGTGGGVCPSPSTMFRGWIVGTLSWNPFIYYSEYSSTMDLSKDPLLWEIPEDK